MVGLLFFLLLAACILARLSMRPGYHRHHWHRPVQDAITVPCPLRSRCKPPWVAREIVRLKAWSPEFGCRAIADAFNRHFAERDVSVGKTYLISVEPQPMKLVSSRKRGSGQGMQSSMA